MKSNKCMTCGNIIGHLYKKFNELKTKKDADIQSDEYFRKEISYDNIFNQLGINKERYCCRKYFITGFDEVDILYGTMET